MAYAPGGPPPGAAQILSSDEALNSMRNRTTWYSFLRNFKDLNGELAALINAKQAAFELEMMLAETKMLKEFFGSLTPLQAEELLTQAKAKQWLGEQKAIVPIPKEIAATENVLYSDGGQNALTGDSAWGSVRDASRRDILAAHTDLCKDMSLGQVQLPDGKRVVCAAKFGDVKSQQNNGAELLALVAALRIANQSLAPNAPTGIAYNVVASDSQLLVVYWSKGHVNGKTKASMDPLKLKWIQECASQRSIFESRGGKIIQIPGNQNPADLGYHK